MTIIEHMIYGFKSALGDPVVSRLVLLSLEITVMAVLALILIRAMRIKSMRFVALVWLIVLAKPILGLFIGSPLHLFDFQKPVFLDMNSSQNETSKLDEMIAAQMEKDRERLSEKPMQMIVTGAVETAPKEVQKPAESRKNSESISIPLGNILKVVWFLGVGFFVFLTLIDLLRIRRLKKSALSPSREIEKLYMDLSQEMGIRRIPELGMCSVLESPALVGIIHPMILLPQWLCEKYNYSQIKWLMRHELTHWMHKDTIALVLRRVSEILFFFHPVIWWAGRRWEETMELACDRAILHSEPEARLYAEHLFRILENQQKRLRYPLSAGLFATRTQIGKRIAALLSNPLKYPAHLGILSVSALFILAIIGFSLGLGFQRESVAREAKKSNVQALSSEDEKEVQEKISGINADLRSLHVALEAYNVDNNVYPLKFHVLTTPIAYLTKIPSDPFAVSETGAVSPESQSLKMGFAPDYKSIYLYSIGPDGVDQEGSATYDPTNGALSSGDIVRIVDVGDHTILQMKDRDLQEKVDTQKNDLLMVKSALESWFLAKRNLPDNLNQLVSPPGFIKKIPEDIFASGKPVSYIYDKEGGIALIYSIGPDKIGDNGIVEISGFHEKGDIPKGDIVLKVELAELEERHPQKISSRAMKNDIMMQDLLKMKEKDGKDNALIHYQMASRLMPSIPNQIQSDLIAKILKQGWDKSADDLVPYINSFKPMFDEIRKGAALDYAKNVGWERGPATPVPNFLAAQISAKMLCVEGRYLESQGKYREALDNYLTVLTMGRDYGAPEGTLIGVLISIAIDQISLNQIYHIMNSGNLDASSLQMALDRLKFVESTQSDIASAFLWEYKCIKWQFNKMREDPKYRDESYDELANQLAKDGVKVEETKETFYSILDRLEREYQQYQDFEIEYINTPYWERNPEEYKKKVEEMQASFHPFNKNRHPNYIAADVRYMVMVSKMRKARIATALAIFRVKNGRYPASLESLVPQYFNALLVDPFNGNGFIYELLPEGKSYILYGVGPDKKDDENKIPYDPTNGTLSAGDIIN